MVRLSSNPSKEPTVATVKTLIIDGPHAGQWVDFPEGALFWESVVAPTPPPIGGMGEPLPSTSQFCSRIVYYPFRIRLYGQNDHGQERTVLTAAHDTVSALYVFDCLLKLAGGSDE